MKWLSILMSGVGWVKNLGGIKLYLIIAGACLSIGLYSGYKVTSWKYSAANLAAMKQIKAEYEEKLEKNKKIEIRYIEKEGKEKIIYRDKVKKVIEYVQTNPDSNTHECFSDPERGLQLYRDALTGGTDPSKPSD